jgi:hypothetical protein
MFLNTMSLIALNKWESEWKHSWHNIFYSSWMWYWLISFGSEIRERLWINKPTTLRLDLEKFSFSVYSIRGTEPPNLTFFYLFTFPNLWFMINLWRAQIRAKAISSFSFSEDTINGKVSKEINYWRKLFPFTAWDVGQLHLSAWQRTLTFGWSSSTIVERAISEYENG